MTKPQKNGGYNSRLSIKRDIDDNHKPNLDCKRQREKEAIFIQTRFE